MPRLDDLLPYTLRPAGGGIYTVSSGRGAEADLQRALYGLPAGASPDDIQKMWKKSFADLAQTRVAVLGVPSDTGAGVKRGAAYGPRAVREAMLALPEYRELLSKKEVVDLGDVLVNPHLLHDEMLSDAQIAASREAMFAEAPPAIRGTLAVSPLSLTELVLSALLAQHPHLRLFMIGGDHSVAWPVTQALTAHGKLGIVQPDAHTDMLSSRMGVKYCFGTWSYHASKLLGPEHLVQLGIRISGRDKKHWESVSGARQYWMDEIRAKGEDVVLGELVAHFKKLGVSRLYFSNDIDGTDAREAPATGAPVEDGLSSTFILKAIERLGSEFELVGADIMEVAPDLASPSESKKTCSLAAKYALACLRKQIS